MPSKGRGDLGYMRKRGGGDEKHTKGVGDDA
jgi:hypothetical protein